jgi:hypothetical protein
MYDESFWNKRYADRDYLYGTEPNSFLAEHYGLLRSPVLSLSEGEGRNAVFLACCGFAASSFADSKNGIYERRRAVKR